MGFVSVKRARILVIGLVMTLGLLAAAERASAQLSFSAPSSLAVGSYPYSVTTADFNGDGEIDLASANRNSNNLSVLLGNGDGSFAGATNFVAGSDPQTVTTADFNGDGEIDLASANTNSNNLSVLLGNGDGTFAAAANFAAGVDPASVTTADFNGDGDIDLASANTNSNDLSVLLGNGDGSFADASDFHIGGFPLSVTSADFNGDGNPDLASANMGALSVLLGNGDGSFAAAADFTAEGMPSSVTTADFNGDGDVDLASANQFSDNLSVLLGNGDGGFAGASYLDVGSTPISVTTADFNGDGKIDLASANQLTYDLSVLLGSGDGSFAGARYFDVGSIPLSVTSADFNGDSMPDLASGNTVADGSSSDLSILINLGLAPETLITGGPTGTTVATRAQFTFSSPDAGASFECQLDDGQWSPCESPTTVSSLGDGQHSFRVRAITLAEGTDPTPAERSWNVDTSTPPTARISVGPNPVMTGETVSLDATSSLDHADGSIVSYAWDAEGDGTFESTSATGVTRHSYDRRGTFEATVRVTNDSGKTAVASRSVEVRLAPPPGPLGVSLNAGARYTNDPDVKISAVWPMLATGALVSNDGGFASAKSRAVAPKISWKLDSSGPERLPKTIYVRFVGGASGLETYQDDIILDETDPVLKSGSASLAGGSFSSSAISTRSIASTSGKKRGKSKVILRTKAKDRTSGVRKIQVGTRKSKKLKKLNYRKKLKLKTASRKLWVRVFDRAGNSSRWKRVKVKR